MGGNLHQKTYDDIEFRGQPCRLILHVESASIQNFFDTVLGASAIIFLYCIDRESTFKEIEKAHEKRGILDKNPLAYLVGNKVDLEQDRLVDKKEARDFASKRDMRFKEISALDKNSVNSVWMAY